MVVKITNPATCLVLNRYGSAARAPAKGDALTLYTDTGSNDQRFNMVYKGDFVYFVLCSNPTLVVNRHSKTGHLMLWPLMESTDSDILFNTETVDGKMRLIMPHYKLYATAPDLAVGGNIETEGSLEYNGTQYFELVEAAAGGANTNAGASTDPYKKTLAVPCSNQMKWSGTHCFAAVVLDIANFFGYNITMDTLAAKGCIRRSDGFVYTSAPYFAQTITCIGASEATYCKAITEQINLGRPVIIKISGSAGDHFICAVSGGASPDEIMVNDPMIGRVTLRKAFQRKGQKFVHIRVVNKL